MSQQNSSPTEADFDLKQTATTGRLEGLWLMLSGYHALFIGATVAIGLAALMQTGFYYLIRYFTDNVLLGDAAASQLPWVALGFVVLALLQGVFTFTSGRWAAAAAEGVTVRLRNYLFDHIQRLSFTYHDRTPTGELIQRATSDVDALRRFFAEQAIGVGPIVLLFLVNFVALLFLNWRLAPHLRGHDPGHPGVCRLSFFRRIEKRYEAFQEQEAQLSTTLQENLTGVRVVQGLCPPGVRRSEVRGRQPGKVSCAAVICC